MRERGPRTLWPQNIGNSPTECFLAGVSVVDGDENNSALSHRTEVLAFPSATVPNAEQIRIREFPVQGSTMMRPSGPRGAGG